MRDLVNLLADIPPQAYPFISVYADLSPDLEAGTRPYDSGNDDAPKRSWRRDDSGERGHVRPGITAVRDLLREKEYLIAERGPERDSFERDRDRILEYLETSEFDNASQGVVIFACSGAGRWEAHELAVPVPTQVAVDKTPLLYPLVRLDDTYQRFALCIADSESARVYVVAMGKVETEQTVEGQEINRTMTGGWSQKRIQQRIDNAVTNHVREVAERLENLVFNEDIPYIVLGGDETMHAEFRKHLSDRAWVRVIAFERLDMNLSQDEAISRAWNNVLEAEKQDARDLAQQARDNALSDGLGTYGVKAVRHALEQGAVDTLLLDPQFSKEEGLENFTEMAFATGATVHFIEESKDLKQMRNIAAILRWKPDTLPQMPPLREVTMPSTSPEEALVRTG
jgi:peptide subunit release factor 1 (eRF1)